MDFALKDHVNGLEAVQQRLMDCSGMSPQGYFGPTSANGKAASGTQHAPTYGCKGLSHISTGGM
jgi:hypothetical protein